MRHRPYVITRLLASVTQYLLSWDRSVLVEYLHHTVQQDFRWQRSRQCSVWFGENVGWRQSYEKLADLVS